MSCFLRKYNDQMKNFSRQISPILLVPANLILASVLLFYIITLIFYQQVWIYNTSVFSSLMTTVSGSIILPTITYIKNMPAVKVEVLNNKFSYNKNSILELKTNDFLNIRAINSYKDSQVIKFLGFCHVKDENSIAMKKRKFYNNNYLPKNNIEGKKCVVSTSEIVAPHTVSREYYDIAVPEIIIPLLNLQDIDKKNINRWVNRYSSAEIFMLLIERGHITEITLFKALLRCYTSAENVEIIMKHQIIINIIKKALLKNCKSSEINDKLVDQKILNNSMSIIKLFTSVEIIDSLTQDNNLQKKLIEKLVKTKKKQKYIFIDAIYENGDGNLFFKTFNIAI